MGLIDFPDPVSMFEGAKTAGLEQKAINALVSTAYSSWIAFAWSAGASKLANWLGLGQAFRDSATAMYLSLRELETKNFLTLTVPKELLGADNVAKFQTEEKTK
jgi:hypothetical protein